MSQARYPTALIALHWLTLLLIVAAYIGMEFRGEFPRGSAARNWMVSVHYSAGLSVLALVLVRLALRLRGGIPPVTPPLAPVQRLGAAAGHAALYLFMLGMPLLGWLLVSADDKAFSLWGLPLPALLAPDPDLAHTLEEIHEIGATVGYVLIALHVAAAIYHHYLRRDDTLKRMLPGR